MLETLDLLKTIPTMNTLSMRMNLINRFKVLAKFKQPYKLATKEDKHRLEDIFTIMKCVEKLFSVILLKICFFYYFIFCIQ